MVAERDASCASGVTYRCRPCSTRRSLERYHRNKERILAARRLRRAMKKESPGKLDDANFFGDAAHVFGAPVLSQLEWLDADMPWRDEE